MDKNFLIDSSLFDNYPDMCFFVNQSGEIKTLNKESKKRLDIGNKERQEYETDEINETDENYYGVISRKHSKICNSELSVEITP